MLPVPDSEVNEYDLNNETDLKYKSLILNEIVWIEKNTNFIVKSAKQLYDLKIHETENINESNKLFYSSIIPFKDAEKKFLEFISKKSIE